MFNHENRELKSIQQVLQTDEMEHECAKKIVSCMRTIYRSKCRFPRKGESWKLAAMWE